MAVSSTTAKLYIPHQTFTPLNPKNGTIFSNSISFCPKTTKFSIKSSSDLSAETTSTDVESESSIEVPKGPPSLISALNVEKALRGIPITDVDHYDTLGLQRGCSYEQVPVAYNKKIEELKEQGLDQEEFSKKMELLKESYYILSSEEERRLYDWSLARSETPDRYAWPFEVDKTKVTSENPPPQEPEDVGPTRLVGYAFLGWLVLSIVIPFFLNR
ncbi:hypothetical protein HS088_TW09G01226 [Tripterygium wilfordii]|uniref:J domain-containing protein n=1 Tax=Tripterygium wilfordii TaxID=458696 RepID=A0A7J7DA27_TRIWF|nr:NAD(P)H-quinone oxidoreductase subunit U, chloroplastic [Tripterygium wilfordii]KAF5743161.1 hypothetical protein HS088_TW09G01226 [Tripterygium wilfordii]